MKVGYIMTYSGMMSTYLSEYKEYVRKFTSIFKFSELQF